MKPRAGQIAFQYGVQQHRICGLVARRQYGKTSIAALICLFKMMKLRGHTVVFGSVKLDLGREIVRKESEALMRVIRTLIESYRNQDRLIGVVDSNKGDRASVGSNAIPFGADDWADLYEAQRLELRLYHDRTTYSRTKVVALTASAVGETGDLVLDEVGRVRDFRGVWEAVKPIIASQPHFRCIVTTTPPPDDAHYSFELLAPPVGHPFPIKPEGNWYRSAEGVWVLRVTADDAYADGVALYDDDTGQPISPDESRAKDSDKDAWDRNYRCLFKFGGTAAVGFLVLDAAQARGARPENPCRHVHLDDDSDFDGALTWLRQHIDERAPVGIGVDVATTTEGTSNPTAVSIVERHGAEFVVRLVLTWKTTDPQVAHERLARIVQAVAARRGGVRNPARRLNIDGTNERYFARDVQRKLRGEVPVRIIVASESVERPGLEEPMNHKQWLGSLLVGEMDDNHVTLPPERYIREDFRLVRKERGVFTCTPDVAGRHGDTFDSTKLGFDAATSSGVMEFSSTAGGSRRERLTSGINRRAW